MGGAERARARSFVRAQKSSRWISIVVKCRLREYWQKLMKYELGELELWVLAPSGHE